MEEKLSLPTHNITDEVESQNEVDYKEDRTTIFSTVCFHHDIWITINNEIFEYTHTHIISMYMYTDRKYERRLMSMLTTHLAVVVVMNRLTKERPNVSKYCKSEVRQ